MDKNKDLIYHLEISCRMLISTGIRGILTQSMTYFSISFHFQKEKFEEEEKEKEKGEMSKTNLCVQEDINSIHTEPGRRDADKEYS